MVEEIRKIYIRDVETLSWMDPETKQMALKKVKLQAVKFIFKHPVGSCRCALVKRG